MRFYADLHIHSKYSRACSRDCDLEHLAWWARRKGITVLGTGDCTHPRWFEELRSTLIPAEPGLYRLRDDLDRAVARRLPPSCQGAVRFMLSVEISTIYKRAERTRKLHHLIYLPDFEAAGAFNRRLGRIGNIAADGRPILGLDSRDLLELTLDSGDGAYLVPAHVWTPWFGLLGSKSGFDTVEECYGELTRHIFALETGLSSDPAMNWRVSALDRHRLVSHSDAHSPPMLGREASVFDTDLDYFAMRQALETGERYGGTIEFFPEEGKYHLDGHRKCGVRLEPAETRRRGGLCPVCGKPLTVGVLHRVEELADRPQGTRPDGAAGFRNLVPLPELLGEILGVGSKSKAVAMQLTALVDRLGPELPLLEQVPLEAIRRAGSPLLAEAVDRLRRGAVIREAGYDGEYGVIHLFDERELRAPAGGATLFEPAPAGRAPAAPAAQTGRAPAARAAAARPPTGRPPTPPDGAAAGSDGGVPPLLQGLDPEQRAAAAVTDGPLLIIAGPGTGKTRTLTHRIAHLVTGCGVAPERCLAITFTRRAAEELRERLHALLPGWGERIEATTFHGLGLAILREQHAAAGLGEDFRIADETERLALVRELTGGSEREARRLLPELSRAKRTQAAQAAQAAGAVLRATPDATPAVGAAPAATPAGVALARYRQALRARALVDFDDLVALPVALLAADPALARRYRERWPQISVDEYQDVDELQYRLLRLLTRPDGNLCAIGDPDQAIYGFRGADVGFFLRFRQDYPTARTVHLTRNYRSSPAIVRGALQAIAPATLVRDRVLAAARQEELPARLVVHQAPSEQAEAEFVVHTIDRLLGGSSFFSMDSGRVDADGHGGLSFADIAVLYRTDAQAEPLVEALARAGMPFRQRSHQRLADRPAVQAIVRVLRDGPAERGGSPERDGPAERGEAPTVMAAARRAADAAMRALGHDPPAAPTPAAPTPAAPTPAEIADALELLAPLAEGCGADLRRFLAELVLGAEVDAWDPRADRVALLTLHAAKGLEFPVVFLVGCEDGLLPLRWGATAAGPDPGEERRLFFVGITRARSHLFLSHAARRTRHGTVRDATPSPFLADIDEVLLERVRAARAPRRAAASAGDQLSLL